MTAPVHATLRPAAPQPLGPAHLRAYRGVKLDASIDLITQTARIRLDVRTNGAEGLVPGYPIPDHAGEVELVVDLAEILAHYTTGTVGPDEYDTPGSRLVVVNGDPYWFEPADRDRHGMVRPSPLVIAEP